MNQGNNNYDSQQPRQSYYPEEELEFDDPIYDNKGSQQQQQQQPSQYPQQPPSQQPMDRTHRYPSQNPPQTTHSRDNDNRKIQEEDQRQCPTGVCGIPQIPKLDQLEKKTNTDARKKQVISPVKKKEIVKNDTSTGSYIIIPIGIAVCYFVLNSNTTSKIISKYLPSGNDFKGLLSRMAIIVGLYYVLRLASDKLSL
jgi:hypothetical protein